MFQDNFLISMKEATWYRSIQVDYNAYNALSQQKRQQRHIVLLIE